MAIYLSIDCLRKETATPSVYYGYAQSVSAIDTDSVWAIRRIPTTGATDSVSWNDGKLLSHSAKWSERAQCFATPSGSLGVTWSITNYQNSFAITYSNINISWTDLSGVNLYRILISDNLGVIYNYLGEPFKNTYVTTPLTSEITNNSYLFRGTTNMTYSVSVTGVNVIGSTTSTVSIKT